MVDIKSLVRKNILDLVPYSSARDEYTGKDAILMDANESPFNGPYNRYPDPRQGELKVKLARMLGLSVGQLFLGNGSDEAIDLLFRVFCNPGIDRAIIMDPSYGMYKVCADINDVEVDFVELDPDFRLNAGRMLNRVENSTKIIFLCSPNNPTSNLLEEAEIVRILEGFKGIVVVDEAYIDFTGGMGLIHLLGKYNNLVILRTLSKAWAGAGIRLGMALGDPFLISLLGRVKYPYNVNLLSQEKALELLNGVQQKMDWVETILAERKRLVEELNALKPVRQVHPSDANFLLIRVDDPDKLYEYLAEGGIIVRNRSRLKHCSGCLRITVGTKEENDRLIELMKLY
ncbi:histidinol-phosphate transaminase [Bacteroidota bacterium]